MTLCFFPGYEWQIKPIYVHGCLLPRFWKLVREKDLGDASVYCYMGRGWGNEGSSQYKRTAVKVKYMIAKDF